MGLFELLERFGNLQSLEQTLCPLNSVQTAELEKRLKSNIIKPKRAN